MKNMFTCAVRQPNRFVQWVHVAAENPQDAARSAVEKIQLSGRCSVEIYRGRSIPSDLDATPVAVTSLIA